MSLLGWFENWWSQPEGHKKLRLQDWKACAQTCKQTRHLVQHLLFQHCSPLRWREPRSSGPSTASDQGRDCYCQHKCPCTHLGGSETSSAAWLQPLWLHLASNQGHTVGEKWNHHRSAAPRPQTPAMPPAKAKDCHHSLKKPGSLTVSCSNSMGHTPPW